MYREEVKNLVFCTGARSTGRAPARARRTVHPAKCNPAGKLRITPRGTIGPLRAYPRHPRSGNAMTTRGSWFSRSLLLITCSLLACGGGNSGPTGPVTGSLAVAVSGLPERCVGFGLGEWAPEGWAAYGVPDDIEYRARGAPSHVSGGRHRLLSVARSPRGRKTTSRPRQPLCMTPRPPLTVTISGPPGAAADMVPGTSPSLARHSAPAPRAPTPLRPMGSSGGTDYSPNQPSQTVAAPAALQRRPRDVRGRGPEPAIDGLYLTPECPDVRRCRPHRAKPGPAGVGARARPMRRLPVGHILQHQSQSNAPGLTTPLAPDESSFSKSWTLAPKALIQPNLSDISRSRSRQYRGGKRTRGTTSIRHAAGPGREESQPDVQRPVRASHGHRTTRKRQQRQRGRSSPRR